MTMKPMPGITTQQPPAKAGGLVLRTESPDTRQRRVDASFPS